MRLPQWKLRCLRITFREAGSEGVFEFGAEEEAEVEIPQTRRFQGSILGVGSLEFARPREEEGLHHEECSTFLERTIQKCSSGGVGGSNFSAGMPSGAGMGSCSFLVAPASQEVG